MQLPIPAGDNRLRQQSPQGGSLSYAIHQCLPMTCRKATNKYGKIDQDHTIMQ